MRSLICYHCFGSHFSKQSLEIPTDWWFWGDRKTVLCLFLHGTLKPYVFTSAAGVSFHDFCHSSGILQPVRCYAWNTKPFYHKRDKNASCLNLFRLKLWICMCFLSVEEIAGQTPWEPSLTPSIKSYQDTS